MSLPEFPKSLPVPDSIKERPLYQFTAADLCGDESYSKLAKLLFFEPESEFYLFLEKGRHENAAIQERLKEFGVVVENSEFYYYLVPGHDRHFIKIREADHPQLEEIKKNSRHYFRDTLKLSNRMREYMNNQELLALQKAQPEQLLSITPGFWGISFNLREVFRRLKRLLSRNR